MAGKVISRTPKVDDNTRTADLSISDQMALIFSHVGNDDEAELDSREKLSTARLKDIASLRSLLQTAADNMKKKKKNSVTLKVHSSFLPYLEEVIDDQRGLGRFYKFDVRGNNLTEKYDYFFVITMKTKLTTA
jgi:hypothetical protein